MKRIRQRLTYANVMSSLAVFLVLGGATAFAASKIGPNQLKAGAVTTNKMAKESVKTGKIFKEAVSTAKIKNNAVNGAKVDEATLGPVPIAETAAPRAYARAIASTEGGGVTESMSKGVADTNVTFVGGSVYCFELGFKPTNIQATVDWIGGGANTFAHATLQAFASCPAGTDASVRTTSNAGAGIGNISFYAIFIG